MLVFSLGEKQEREREGERKGEREERKRREWEREGRERKERRERERKGENERGNNLNEIFKKSPDSLETVLIWLFIGFEKRRRNEREEKEWLWGEENDGKVVLCQEWDLTRDWEEGRKNNNVRGVKEGKVGRGPWIECEGRWTGSCTDAGDSDNEQMRCGFQNTSYLYSLIPLSLSFSLSLFLGFFSRSLPLSVSLIPFDLCSYEQKNNQRYYVGIERR